MKNKTIYLIYDAVKCTPNGDPDSNEQRYNEVTKKATVSDLRLKRYGRDKLNDLGVPIYYFYDKKIIEIAGKSVSGAAARYNAFCKINGIDPQKTDATKVLLENFVDVRLFGGTLTSKPNNAHVMGALQFDAENDSINEVQDGKNLVNRGITTIFPSKDSKGQGSMGRDSYLRYGLFNISGRLNATTAKRNNVTDEDLELMLTSIWDGIKTTNSRSKQGQEPIAFIVVDHPTKEVNNGFLGKSFPKSFKPFEIKTDVPMSDLYRREDYDFDFSPLKTALENGIVENITVYCEDEEFAQKHFEGVTNCNVLNPLDALMELV